MKNRFLIAFGILLIGLFSYHSIWGISAIICNEKNAGSHIEFSASGHCMQTDNCHDCEDDPLTYSATPSVKTKLSDVDFSIFKFTCITHIFSEHFCFPNLFLVSFYESLKIRLAFCEPRRLDLATVFLRI